MIKKQHKSNNKIAPLNKGIDKYIRKPLQHALQGLKVAFREERSFRIEAVAAFIVLAAAVYFKLTLVEGAIIVGIIALVMSLEVFNSLVERMLDASHPGVTRYIGKIKDMAAGAVFIAILGSIVIGVLIFLPYLLDMIR
jgi:undecaprenol kinase